MFGFFTCCSNNSEKIRREASFISSTSDCPSHISFLEIPSSFSHRPRPKFADYYDKDIQSFMHHGSDEASFEENRPRNKAFVLGDDYKIIAKLTSWKISEVLENTDVPNSIAKLTSSETSFEDMFSVKSMRSDFLDEKFKMTEYSDNSKLYLNELEKLSCSSPVDKGFMKDAYKDIMPNNVSKHIAQRLKCDSIIDALCDHSDITIQLAKSCQFVTAIFTNPKKAEISLINSKIHRVNHKIDFVVGDLSQVKKAHADIIFLNPQNTFVDHSPLKRPQSNNSGFSLFKHLKPDLEPLVRQSLSLSQKIAIKLPWYTDLNEISQLFHSILSSSNHKRCCIEIEEILNSNQEIDYLVVYFGDCSSVSTLITF